MEFLRFTFESPQHFFGITALLVILLIAVDSMVDAIASAIRHRGK